MPASGGLFCVMYVVCDLCVLSTEQSHLCHFDRYDRLFYSGSAFCAEIGIVLVLYKNSVCVVRTWNRIICIGFII